MRQGSVENPTIRPSDFWEKCSSVRRVGGHSQNTHRPIIILYVDALRPIALKPPTLPLLCLHLIKPLLPNQERGAPMS